MKYIFITITFLILTITNVFAHPHTFIEVKPTIQIKDDQVNKITIQWLLDEMTSMMLIMELDTNGNGKFEKSENDFIYENYFISLAEYDFYMYIFKNNQELGFIPKNFKASIENDKLIYTFDIEQKIDTENLKIDFRDKELFVGMILEKNFITLKGINLNKTEKLKKQIFGVN